MRCDVALRQTGKGDHRKKSVEASGLHSRRSILCEGGFLRSSDVSVSVSVSVSVVVTRRDGGLDGVLELVHLLADHDLAAQAVLAHAGPTMLQRRVHVHHHAGTDQNYRGHARTYTWTHSITRTHARTSDVI